MVAIKNGPAGLGRHQDRRIHPDDFRGYPAETSGVGTACTMDCSSSSRVGQGSGTSTTDRRVAKRAVAHRGRSVERTLSGRQRVRARQNNPMGDQRCCEGQLTADGSSAKHWVADGNVCKIEEAK